MSFLGPEITTDPLAYEHAYRVAACCAVSSCAIVFYEHLCTFTEEVQLIWGRPLNYIILLFHLNRWANLLYAVVYIEMIFPSLLFPSCTVLERLQQVCEVVEFVVWTVISAIRVYAVSRGNWWLTLGIFALAAIPAGTSFYSLFIVTWQQTPTTSLITVVGTACFMNTALGEAATVDLTVATRVGVIMFDLVVLLVIWHYTHNTLQRSGNRNRMLAPLSRILVRDGSMYFIALMTLNLVLIGTAIAKSTGLFATYLRVPVSATIISRFILNIRSAAHTSLNDTDSSRLVFYDASTLDNLELRTADLEFAPISVTEDEGMLVDSDVEDINALSDDEGEADIESSSPRTLRRAV